MNTSDSVVDVVRLECELREAVSGYNTADELRLAIENAKVLSGIAPEAGQRAMCLMRLVALHDRRRVLAL